MDRVVNSLVLYKKLKRATVKNHRYYILYLLDSSVSDEKKIMIIM